MSRVITFSRTFPAYHPKAGEPTHFIEKIWKSLDGVFTDQKSIYPTISIEYPYDENTYYAMRDIVYYAAKIYDRSDIISKRHTIRAGNRWKVGERFSPRVWSGKPYHIKQIIIAPDIEIKKIWQFEIDACGVIALDGKYWMLDVDAMEHPFQAFAANDGLTPDDMERWFIPDYRKFKGFSGQIISWCDKINY